MKSYFFKFLVILISSLSLISCTKEKDGLTTSSKIIIENTKETDSTSSSSILDSSNEVSLGDSQPLELSDEIYTGDEVLDIIINYNLIIKNFSEAINKIENKEITRDNLHDYFSTDYELRYDNNIYLVGDDKPIFELGKQYKFIPNGLDFSEIIQRKNKTTVFFLKDNLDDEAFIYCYIDFESVNYKHDNLEFRWVFKAIIESR